jgi:hypothetical protein
MLLDGQQRITSLYQVLASGEVVETQDDHKKPIKRGTAVGLVDSFLP